MSVLEQVIGQSLLRNQQALDVGNVFERQRQNQLMQQRQGLMGDIQSNLAGGGSLMEQSGTIAQLATIDPQAATNLNNLFGSMSQRQLQDTFMSVPVAISMPYDQATQFWENKKGEYANNPTVLSQIQSVIDASPEERAKIYDGMMRIGGDIGVLPKKQGVAPTDDIKNMQAYQALKAQGRDEEAEMLARSAGFSDRFKEEQDRADLAIRTAVRKTEAVEGVKQLEGISKDLAKVRTEKANISKMKRLNEKAFSGSLAETRKDMAKFAKLVGIDIEGVSESEQFQALSNALVLDKSQQMSGALSNADMEFLRNTAPTLGNSRESRKAMLDFAERLANRRTEYVRQAKKFKEENGYFLLSDFEREFQQWAEENPLFSDKDRLTIEPQQVTNKKQRDFMSEYGL